MDTGMTFHNGFTDALWLQDWVPKTEGAYLGSLVALFLIAVFSRAVNAARAYFEAWIVIRRQSLPPLNDCKELNDASTTTASNEDVPPPLLIPNVPHFVWRVDLIRGLFGLLATLFGYLLMLVVMTFNTGFFFAVLAGGFMGEIYFGRYNVLAGSEYHSH